MHLASARHEPSKDIELQKHIPTNRYLVDMPPVFTSIIDTLPDNGHNHLVLMTVEKEMQIRMVTVD